MRTYSNGESAFRYFTNKITENGLYLLDEPENSLSPALQQELVQFLSDSARFFGCQFVISTHSPFLLAMRGAKIYDLDEEVVTVKPWTAVFILSNMKSPAEYMQAAFRAQNPYEYEEDGKLYRKENAYVFDFAPERTLMIFDDFENNLNATTANGGGTK